MARHRRKKALYEVIGGSRSNTDAQRGLGNQSPDAESSSSRPAMPARTNWSSRSRLIQFTAGRLEISISYHLAFAVVLGLVLLSVSFFRLGQMSGEKIGPAETAELSAASPAKWKTGAELKKANVVKEAPMISNVAPVESKGSNRIVIQTYQQAEALVPVQQYFAGRGIATEIASYSGMYYLRTVNKYENPGRAGTDGYYALKEIVKVGAGYKAPDGHVNFGPKPFQDAYGMKFSD